MNSTETKSAIQKAVRAFAEGNISENAISLFSTLGYNTQRQNPFEEKTFACFKESFLNTDSRFNGDKALVKEWKSIDLLFQLSKEEVSDAKNFFDKKKVDNTIIEAYLFFAVELAKPAYSRTALAQITREISKVFPMPVMMIFRHGEHLTFSMISRRLHKRDESKDVLEKVTLIKDISIADPHHAHVEILFDLSFGQLKQVHRFSNFVELHNAWQKTLDTSVLNKNFYLAVAAAFTKLVGGERGSGAKKITEKGLLQLPGNPDDTVKKEFAVRLIGRLLFCQFLKKKRSHGDIPLISEMILSKKSVGENHALGYYHCVLEPLFFGALNRKRKDRLPDLQKEDWNLIPFLNGGLFEPHRHDFYQVNEMGISVHVNTLKIPDEWFAELLGIFEHYHFTIEENTPAETEISIDPEMLGRIFENLLAEINPETGETARKSTGSYYTPRAIVEYMTDESLRQILVGKTGIGEDRIARLLSWHEAETDLTEAEKDRVTDALEQLKILDPACGSGAFPMGILQKMILVLQKTDTDSRKWLKKLLANIPDPPAREMMRKKLEGEKELWNYTRKLGVIRNSIYGIDIQPIAAEIAKLRFFLSLVVDEKVSDSDDENRGILPMPNLEFKFVCANALIGLPKGNMGFFESQNEIERLKELHTAYFSSHEDEKEAVKREFAQVQKRMTERLLEWKEIKDSETLRLAAWNPFSGESCGWFDPEWMFGIKDGFDIVIGNPPYIRQEKIRDLKPFLKKTYHVYKVTSDIYTYFFEAGYNFLNHKGILAFITSNKWMRAKYGENIRKFFLDNASLLEIVDFGGKHLFDATVDTNILIFRKEKAASGHLIKFGNCLNHDSQNLGIGMIEEKSCQSFDQANQGSDKIPQSALTANCFTFGSSEIQALKGKIEAKGKPLKDWDVKIYRGITTGLNEVFVIDENLKNQLMQTDKKSSEILKPLLRGKDINKWNFDHKGFYLIYAYTGIDIKKYHSVYEYLLKFKEKLGQVWEAKHKQKKWYELRACDYYPEFEKEKIVYPIITADFTFSYDTKGFFSNDKSFIITGNSLKYLTAFLNSGLFKAVFQDSFPALGEKGRELRKVFFEKVPVLQISQKAQQPFITIVDQIMKEKQANPKADTSALERRTDEMVYELYGLTEEEISIVEGIK